MCDFSCNALVYKRNNITAQNLLKKNATQKSDYFLEKGF